MGIEQVNGVQFGLAEPQQQAPQGLGPFATAADWKPDVVDIQRKKGMSDGEQAAAVVGGGLAVGTAVGIGFFTHKEHSLKKGTEAFGKWVKNIFKREAAPTGNTPKPKKKGGGNGGGSDGHTPTTGAPTTAPKPTRPILDQKKDAHAILNEQDYIKSAVGDTAFKNLHSEVARITDSASAAKFLEKHSDKFLDTTFAANKQATEGEIASLTQRLQDKATDVAELPGIRQKLQTQKAFLAQIELQEKATVRKLEAAFGLQRSEFKADTAFDFAAHGGSPRVKYTFTSDAKQHGMPLKDSNVYRDTNGNIVHGDVEVGIHMPGLANAADTPFAPATKRSLAGALESAKLGKLSNLDLDDKKFVSALYKKRASLPTGTDQQKFDAILKNYGIELNPTSVAQGTKFVPKDHPNVSVQQVHITDDPKLHGQIADVNPGHTYASATRPESVNLYIHPETAKLDFEGHKALRDQIDKVYSDPALFKKVDDEFMRFSGESGQQTVVGMFPRLNQSTNADESRELFAELFKDKDAAAFLKRLKNTTVPGEQSAVLEQLRAQVKTVDGSGNLTRQLDQILN